MIHGQRTAFFTVCYPKALRYSEEFFRSLASQTDNSFDVVVVNDSCGSLRGLTENYGSLNIFEIPATGGLAAVRQTGLSEVVSRGYEQVVFGDFDDRFSPDRVAKAKALLDKWDVVVNDVDLFGARSASRYFSSRIADGSRIKLEDILAKNFMGFSNTAMRVSWFKDIVLADTIAVDWYLFSRVLARGAKAYFCGLPLTEYRQHGENVAVFGGDKERSREVKRLHYQALTRDCPQLVTLLNDSERKVVRDDKNPFWWED